MQIKWLGLGHPRTGTGYTAALLQSWGLDVGHERLGADGIIAWQLLFAQGPWPYMPRVNKELKQRPDWQHLIYNVREPKSAIASIVNTEGTSAKYRFKQIGINPPKSRVEAAIISLLYFDKQIQELKPDIVYRIEDQSQELYDYASQHAQLTEYTKPEQPVNQRRHKGFEKIEAQFLAVRPELKEALNQWSQSMGYPMPY